MIVMGRKKYNELIENITLLNDEVSILIDSFLELQNNKEVNVPKEDIKVNNKRISIANVPKEVKDYLVKNNAYVTRLVTDNSNK